MLIVVFEGNRPLAAEDLLEWKALAEWRLANKEQMCVSMFKTLKRVLFRVSGAFFPPLKRWVCRKLTDHANALP
jgi:hypothetical protein